jgi:GTP:adenosylcobinamide-phosphate guanylyltransferase
MGWTAIVLAGSRPGRDEFAESHGTDLKALIPVGGVAMVARPVAALLGAPEVDAVRVLAQQPGRIAAVLPRDARLTVEASGATIAATIQALLADPATRFPLLVTTADHVLLDGAIIADFCGQAAGADVAMGLVEKKALDARLPQTRRTWIRFRGGAYSGANLFAFGSREAASAVALWRQVEQDRKKGWRMIAALGVPLLLGSVLRVRTLDQSLASIGKRLGLSIGKVELANPLAAVNVDKPADHILVSAILAGRAALHQGGGPLGTGGRALAQHAFTRARRIDQDPVEECGPGRSQACGRFVGDGRVARAPAFQVLGQVTCPLRMHFVRHQQARAGQQASQVGGLAARRGG